MKLRHISSAALILAVISTASAAIVPVGEFTGELYEGFEGIIAPGPYSGQMPIFNGAATFDDQYSDPWISFNLFNQAEGIELLAYNGNYLGLVPTGWALFEFETPIYKFGCHMGIVNDVVNSNVTFFDDGGNPIETQGMSLTKGEWTWIGWESDTPIGGVMLHSSENPGMTAIFDEVYASYVPEPTALGLFAVGAALFIKRRR